MIRKKKVVKKGKPKKVTPSKYRPPLPLPNGSLEDIKIGAMSIEEIAELLKAYIPLPPDKQGTLSPENLLWVKKLLVAFYAKASKPEGSMAPLPLDLSQLETPGFWGKLKDKWWIYRSIREDRAQDQAEAEAEELAQFERDRQAREEIEKLQLAVANGTLEEYFEEKHKKIYATDKTEHDKDTNNNFFADLEEKLDSQESFLDKIKRIITDTF